MYHLNQIDPLILPPDILRLFYIAVGILGLYLSLIIIISDRARSPRRIFLGLYLVSLSILLLHVVSLLQPIKFLTGTIQLTGILSLFLVGPFSFWVFHRDEQKWSSQRVIVHCIPAGIFTTLFLATEGDSFWIYMTGLLQAGIYIMILWIVQFRTGSKSRGEQPDSPLVNGIKNKRYTSLLLVVYTSIGISCISGNRMLISLISSVGLSLLILWIWIRLLYTAYLSYLTNNQ